MRQARSLLAFLCLCLLAWIAFPAAAQQASYTKLNVKGRVQLEVPSTWTINDEEQRRRVKEMAEQAMGTPAIHMASLSVHSYPAPWRVLARVSFVPLEPPITQADLRAELKAGKEQVLQDVAEYWAEEAPAMWAAMAKHGMKEVGTPSFDVEPLGGKLALSIRYRRTSTTHPGKTMRVTQYHVVLGEEKALITLSYLDEDPGAIAAHNRLKKSIVIR
jgi:hypothetical protein